MQFEFVFFGFSKAAQMSWERLCFDFRIETRFCNSLSEATKASSSSIDVLLLRFNDRASFAANLRDYVGAGGGSLSIAVLPHPDFILCGEAFRAGASDVLTEPTSIEEFKRIVKHLRTLATRLTHPDAILPLETVEKLAIKTALRACNGQVSKTSRKLGIGRSTLYRKLELYDLTARP